MSSGKRRPGRPEVGAAVHVRLGPELLAAVDGYASDRGGISRAQAMREIIVGGLVALAFKDDPARGEAARDEAGSHLTG